MYVHPSVTEHKGSFLRDGTSPSNCYKWLHLPHIGAIDPSLLVNYWGIVYQKKKPCLINDLRGKLPVEPGTGTYIYKPVRRAAGGLLLLRQWVHGRY